MKKILSMLAAALPLLVSCVDNLVLDEPALSTGADRDKVTLSIGLGIPELEASGVYTKAFGEIDDARRLSLAVRLFVFDENGFFVEYADATNRLEPGDNDFETARRNQTTFSVTLTRSKLPRRIHIVAVDKGSAASFDDVVTMKYQYGSESTVMNGISVGEKVANIDAYWGKVVVQTIDEETDATYFVRVPLLRNFAKFTVRPRGGETTIVDNVNKTEFTATAFVVVNKPASGSVAPYNTTSGGFVDWSKSSTDKESPKGYKEVLATGYSGYQPAGVAWTNKKEDIGDSGDGGLTFIPINASTGSVDYMYESPNADGSDKGRTYIIIKGNFVDKSRNPAVTYTDRYYKVDIIYRETDGYGYDQQQIEDGAGINTFYNILRNFNYIVNINGVSFEGYQSAKEAASMPATNNISASVLADNVNNVSDGNGKRRLFISEIYSLYTSGGAKEDLLCKAITVLGDNQNGNMKIRILSDDGVFETEPVIESGTVDRNGYSKIKFTLKAASSAPKTAKIRVYVCEESQYETLFRDVDIVLREPYSLKVDCTDVVPGSSGTNMNADLLIQDGISEHLFPLTFLMESASKTIYPNSSSTIKLPVHIDNSIVPGQTAASSFQYEREVTWDQYSNAQIKSIGGINYRILPCYFKTNTASSATTVYAVNREYFSNLADASVPSNDTFLNGAPVFLDGDDAKVTIWPSDYYGAGNSYGYVDFTTVRNTGTVNITLIEGTETTTRSYDLATTADRTATAVPATTVDGVAIPATTLYTYHVPFLTKTFAGNSYTAQVSYSTDYNDEINGSATLDRRYLFIPLYSFDTNITTANGFQATGARFRSELVNGTVTSYTGKVGFVEKGSVEGWDSTKDKRNDSASYVYNGYKFGDSAGYHIDLWQSLDSGPLFVPTADTVLHFYDSGSAVHNDWEASVTLGALTAAHAVDFQAGYTDPTGTSQTEILNSALAKDTAAAGRTGSLYKLSLVFAAPTP